MFKLVVLFSLLALAAADYGTLLPYPGYHVYSAPATTIGHQPAVLHPSPVVYSSPLTYSHYIKKRGAPLLNYYNPYLTPTTVPTLVHATPIVHSAQLAYHAAHLIKKRSAPIAPWAPITYNTYLSPHYPATSLYTPYTPLIHSSPLIHTPITYSHLIKKRSAPLALAYSPSFIPTSYSHQSRIDLHTSPLITSYTSPIAYSSPLVHYIKK